MHSLLEALPRKHLEQLLGPQSVEASVTTIVPWQGREAGDLFAVAYYV